MDSEREIRQAIDVNLTVEVAEKLNTILDEGVEAKEALERLREDYESIKAGYKRLHDLEGKAALVVKQKETYDELRRELDRDLAILEAVRKERNDAKNQIFELARIVFDNPKLKFQGYLSSSSPDGSSLNADIDGGEMTERS